MCMICASIPAAAAVGAKLNADQTRRKSAGQGSSTEKRRFSIPLLTSLIILFLLVAAFLNHAFGWRLY